MIDPRERPAEQSDDLQSDARRVPARYELRQLLGTGAYGRVWRARDHLNGEDVALKVLFPGRTTADELASEFRVAADVAHAHVMRVLDFGPTSDGASYLVMQLLHGAQEFGQAAHGRPVGDVLRWAGQALMALDALHRRGLMHGDIKASNVLVDPNGVGFAYLADFGLACLAGGTGVGGTPAYLAPELLEGGRRGIAADLYGMGVLLYEALAGHNPFLAEDLHGTLRNQAQLDAPPLDQVNSAVNAPTARFVKRLLAKDPEKRWRSPAQALTELADVCGAGSTTSTEWIIQRLLDPPLVGLDGAISALHDLLASIGTGTGGARWVRGALGCGRTALLAMARQNALVAGLRVGRGAAQLDEGPWAPLVRALSEAVGDAGGDERGRPLDHQCTPAQAAEWVLRAVGERPTLLVLDDVDAGAPELWGCIGYLLQEIDRVPLGLVWATTEGTEAEAAFGSAISLMWTRAARSDRAASCQAHPLSEPDAALLMEGALGDVAEEETLVRPIWRAADGCPAMMLELLRAGLEASQVDHTPSGWVGALSAGILDSARGGLAQAKALVEDRHVELLHATVRSALDALAVVRAPCGLELVAAVAELDLATARGALADLVRLELAHETRRERVEWSVRGSLAGRVVASIPRRRQQFLHARTADALLARPNPSDLPFQVRVALHLVHGGRAEQALGIAEQLADGVSPAALPEAFSSLAAELVALDGDIEASTGWAHRLLRACAESHIVAGRFGEALTASEEARLFATGNERAECELDRLSLDVLASLGRREDCEAMLEAAEQRLQSLQAKGRAEPRDRAELAVRKALAARLAAEPERARAAAEEGLAALAGSPEDHYVALRARLLVELATADLHQSDITGCYQRGEDALRLARLAGDAAVEVQAANAVGNALRQLGDLQEAAEFYLVARQVAEERGWIGAAGKAANNIGVCHYLSGRWEEAAAEWRLAVRFAEQTGECEEKVLVLNNLGFLFFLRGHADRSEQAYTESMELAQEKGLERIAMHLYGNLGELRFRQRRYPAARALYGQANEIADRLDARGEKVELERRMAELLVQQGRPADAAEAAVRALGPAKELGLTAEAARLAGLLAVCSAETGDAVGAAARISEAETLLVNNPSGSMDQTILLLRRALVLEALGETADALSTCRLAKERFDKLGELWFERDAEEAITRLRRREFVEGCQSGPGHADANPGALWEQIQSGQCGLQEIARQLMDQVFEISRATRGTISVQTLREFEGFQVSASREDGADAFLGSGEAFSRTIAMGVLETGREILVENVNDDDCLSATESVRTMELHSVLCLPIMVLGDTRGIMYIDSKSFIGDKLAAAKPLIRALLAAFSTAIEREVFRSRFESQLELAAQVAHELRSPLNSIKGFAEIARWSQPDDGYSEDVQELIDVVDREGDRMNELVRRMYDLWAANSAPEVTLEACRAQEIAERVVRTLRPQAAHAGIELVNEVGRDTPEILADEDAIQQVFTNLVGNAIRHTPRGGRVYLRAASMERPEHLGDRRHLILEVADEGVGLSAENIERVFRKFDRGTNPAGAGSGLGLSICRSIVANHSGKIWVESELGHGARFRFSVPVLVATTEGTGCPGSGSGGVKRSTRPSFG